MTHWLKARHGLVTGFAVSCFAVTTDARAQTASAGTPAPPETGTAGATTAATTVVTPPDGVDDALAIDVEPLAGGLDADALRTAIARETGVAVTSAVSTRTTRLLVRQDGPDRLRFELVEPGGRSIERSVDLSTVAKASALDTAALVAANLLEDEASALVAALRARAEPTTPKIPAPKPAPPEPRELDFCKRRPSDVVHWVGADVAPYVGTSSFESPGTVRHLSLEFVGSHHAGVRGLQFSPLASFGGDFVCGLQFAGLVAHTTGSVRGGSLAGLVGYHGGSVEGGAFAGAGQWIDGSVKGFALAGGAIRTEDTDGLVGSGFLTVARHVEGVHLSGTIGWADSIAGVQIAGVAAFAARKVEGVQIAPLAFASDVSGLQLGTFNIGGYVHGAQIGVVNIARTSDVSIGALSFVSEGRTHLEGWAGSDGTFSVAIQHGSRWVHNYYGGTISFTGDSGVAAGPLLGIGVEIPADRVFVDIDLIASLLLDPEETKKSQSIHQARIIAGLTLAPGVAVFAGPTFNVLFGRAGDAARAHSISALEIDASSGDAQVRLWPGLVAGVRGF